MKKTVLLTYVSFLSFLLKSQIKFGISTGLQTSNLTATTSYGLTSKWKTTPTFGVMGGYHFPKNFIIHSGLQFHQIAYHKTNVQATNEDGNDLGEIDQHTINYIQVPIACSYKVDIGEKNHFYVGLGAAFNIGLSDKIILTHTVPFTVSNPYITGTKGVANAYWSSNFLFGYQMKKIGFRFDLQNSISSIYKKSNLSPNWNATIVRFTAQYFLK